MSPGNIDRRMEAILKWKVPHVQKLDKNSPHYENTLSEVKEIIDRGIDTANDLVIEFNNDYSEVRIRKVFKAMTPAQWAKEVMK